MVRAQGRQPLVKRSLGGYQCPPRRPGSALDAFYSGGDLLTGARRPGPLLEDAPPHAAQRSSLRSTCILRFATSAMVPCTMALLMLVVVLRGAPMDRALKTAPTFAVFAMLHLVRGIRLTRCRAVSAATAPWDGFALSAVSRPCPVAAPAGVEGSGTFAELFVQFFGVGRHAILGSRAVAHLVLRRGLRCSVVVPTCCLRPGASQMGADFVVPPTWCFSVWRLTRCSFRRGASQCFVSDVLQDGASNDVSPT